LDSTGVFQHLITDNEGGVWEKWHRKPIVNIGEAESDLYWRQRDRQSDWEISGVSYITGKYGGAAFVLVYLANLFVGFSHACRNGHRRKAQLNAVGSFLKLRGGAWPIDG
jgi:hypothetical protein